VNKSEESNNEIVIESGIGRITSSGLLVEIYII
jgi:hypothetical protein